MSTARAAWNQEIETRVAATSNILAQIKGIKSMGLSNTMGEYLQEKRRKEISVSMRERRTRIYLFALGEFDTLNKISTRLLVTKFKPPRASPSRHSVCLLVRFSGHGLQIH